MPVPSQTSNTSQSFTLYPAIDVLGGACVRLLKGDYGASTQYGNSPRAMAERWLSQGARFLHVVDLDGAKSGSLVNRDAIREVVEAAREVGAKVQVGGGIRSYDAVAGWLDAGVARCVIGTAALEPGFMEEAVKRFGGEGLVVGLDGRNGRIAVRGWIDQTDVTMVEVANRLLGVGVRHALVTDVDKDGTLEGANLGLASEIQSTGMAAIASGGIRDLNDVLAAKASGLSGAIAGRSIYDGTLDVKAALTALEAV